MGRFQAIGSIQPFLKLHEGIWADVYKAYDTSLERYILLKLLKPEFAGDAAIAAQFEAEAQLMARIEHPNVVRVLSFGRAEQAVYFVAEFIEGASLKGLIEAQRIPPFLATHIMREATAGLLAAHRQNIFHRDIKPSNVLISNIGAVKLTDFGMSSLMFEEEPLRDGMQTEAIRGTLAYLGPEHVFDPTPTITSDLFALGATYFEMLTGQPAFRGNNTSEIFDRVLHHDPIPFLAANPSIAPEIVRICDRLLKKEPAHRFQQTESLLAALGEVLSNLAVPINQASLASYLDDASTYAEPCKQTRPDDTNPQTSSASVNDLNHLPVPKRKNTLFATAAIFVLSLILIVATTLYKDPPEDVQMSPVIPSGNDSLATPDEQTRQSSEPVPSATIETARLSPLATGTSIGPQLEEETNPNTTGTAPAQTVDTVLTDLAPALASRSVPATGSLAILCTPWCDVWVDGDSLGQAPSMLPATLNPGLYSVVLKHPSFPPFAQDVRIEAGQLDSIKVSLWDHVGVINLDVVPFAEVYINSVFYGPVPPSKSIILPPGTHELTLKNEPLGDLNITLIIAAGEKKKLSYNLNERLR